MKHTTKTPEKSAREALLFSIRKALLRLHFRQLSSCEFEGTNRHGTFRVLLTRISIEKQIQRCEFEREPGTNRAWVRPGDVNIPYWWEDYGFGWLKDISVDEQGRIRGMIRYKNVKTY